MWSLHMPFTISLRHLSLMLHGAHAQTPGIRTDVGQQEPWTQLSQLNPEHLQKNFMSKILTTGVATNPKALWKWASLCSCNASSLCLQGAQYKYQPG